MSITILALAKSFIDGRLSVNDFVNTYMELWKFERDAGFLQKDSDVLSECLSSIFCVVDLYNPDLDRAEYELDEEQLRSSILELINCISPDLMLSRS